MLESPVVPGFVGLANTLLRALVLEGHGQVRLTVTTRGCAIWRGTCGVIGHSTFEPGGPIRPLGFAPVSSLSLPSASTDSFSSK